MRETDPVTVNQVRFKAKRSAQIVRSISIIKELRHTVDKRIVLYGGSTVPYVLIQDRLAQSDDEPNDLIKTSRAPLFQQLNRLSILFLKRTWDVDALNIV